MNICLACHKKLVPIGTSRKNGKNHADWRNRQYHKACWKELNWYDDFVYFDIDIKRKDEARKLGARWDSEKKLWYAINNAVESNLIQNKFRRHTKGTAKTKIEGNQLINLFKEIIYSDT